MGSSPEEGGADHDAAYDAGYAEPDQRPVVTGLPPAARLPAVVDLSLVAEVYVE